MKMIAGLDRDEVYDLAFAALGETADTRLLLQDFVCVSKCIFRVRCKIDGRWSDEGSSLVSQILLV